MMETSDVPGEARAYNLRIDEAKLNWMGWFSMELMKPQLNETPE